MQMSTLFNIMRTVSSGEIRRRSGGDQEETGRRSGGDQEELSGEESRETEKSDGALEKDGEGLVVKKKDARSSRFDSATVCVGVHVCA